MAKKYLIVDGMNMFFRASHVVSPSSGLDNMIGMGFHIIFNSMLKAWRDFDADHVVFCLDGRSWRKDVYPKYKLNRKADRMARTEIEAENDQIMMDAFNEFCEFVDTKTNVSVLKCSDAEADDLIAFWVDSHPHDEHVILSSDSDFVQLLAPNCSIYNGIDKVNIRLDGYYDDNGNPVIDKKTGEQKMPLDPEYHLFLKCIRGDKSDNVFSAFPGAREKGSSKKVGIREAFEDRHAKGFAWNNFMLQRWTDHEDVEHIVKEDYERNRHLIDLRAQPDEIKIACAHTIAAAADAEAIGNVGIHFMKFCGLWDLKRLSDNSQAFSKMLNAKYC
jgi:5'-3' exonuclease